MIHGVLASRLQVGLPLNRLTLRLDVLDHPLIFVACFAQLLDMLLGDVLLALRSSFEQLKARRLAVLQLPFAALFLSLEILNKVHGDQPRPI